MKILKTSQQGFTIVEFMIATVVFSVILLLCATAIVHVGRMYYKGVVTNRTQDTARRVVEDISQAIQTGIGSDDPSEFVRYGVSGALQARCIGTTRYNYITGSSLGTGPTQSPHILWRDRTNEDSCVPVAFGPGAEELLGANMRLPYFDITHVSNNLYNVSIRLTYGDDPTLYEGTGFEFCRGTTAGGQFCAISAFSTTVSKRL